MHIVRLIVAAILVVAAFAASIPYAIAPQNGASIEGYQSAAALTFFFAFIGVGAALLFALSLKGFKSSFKKAYAFICTGLILHGLSMLAFPVIMLYTPYFWTDLPNLLGDAPYLVGTILIFIGVVQFAKLLSQRSWLHNPFIVVAVALAITLAAWPLPHAAYNFSELQFNLVKSVLWLECIFTLFSLPILWRILRGTSFIYGRPLAWLVAAAGSNFVAGAVYAFSNYVRLPAEQSAVMYDVVGIIYAFTQLLFLVAGYSFNRITRVEALPKEDGTPFDIITYLASLASQPKAIDQLLDPLREITASYSPGAPLDGPTLARLAAVYADIETYLVTNESLRSFTREDLRRDIQSRFNPNAYANLFQASSAAPIEPIAYSLAKP